MNEIYEFKKARSEHCSFVGFEKCCIKFIVHTHTHACKMFKMANTLKTIKMFVLYMSQAIDDERRYT